MPRLLLAVCAALAVPTNAAAGPPRLAVLIVFDQMRGDYPQRWRDLFEDGGFRRLTAEGAWFAHCHYPYAGTSTGPGHSSLLTGCSPDRHGCVGNLWYDRAAGEPAYCAGSPRYDRLPPPEKAKEEPKEEKKDDDKKDDEKKPKGSGAPVRLLAPTLADVLKA